MTITDDKIKLPLRSVSQLNQYTRCPLAYKLARRDKVWARPAAWLPQGSAVHTVLEHAVLDDLPLEEAIELFKEEYSKEVARYTEITPNLDWWTWSGPYNGERDLERRWELGIEQVEKFYKFLEGGVKGHPNGQKIWTTPALPCEKHTMVDHGCKDCKPPTPAVELYFMIELDGIRIRGYIDAVVELPDGSLRVRDYKTGATPGDDFQLAVYALAISMMYGIEKPETGDYYMAGKKGKVGKPTTPYDLTDWTRDKISEAFWEAEHGIEAEEFPALPEADKCMFCDVNYHCPEFNS
ncbi:Cas4 exonuclease [Gordonia phage Nedarya]|nr:Cas4 exonuclease [Gordonia phage Nedarya]